MANMSLTKTPIARAGAKGKKLETSRKLLLVTHLNMAIEEAQRCLNCKHKPCMTGCPVSVRIPEFVAKVAEGKFEEAYAIIKTTNSLRRLSAAVFVLRSISARASA